MNALLRRAVEVVSLLAFSPALLPAQDAAEVAKKLANPISSLISVPLQLNLDQHIGPASGTRVLVNLQPVLPVAISPQWNLITRVITPVMSQNNVAGNSGTQSGLGDIVPTLFFSPKAPTSSGIIWGAGPVMLLPTASHEMLGGRKFGVGPSVVLLRQTGPLTVGALANHMWSVAGDANRPDVNSTFLQPFVSYTSKSATSYGIDFEATHDANTRTWLVPLNATVGQVVRMSGQLLSVGGGLRYWIGPPDSGPSGLGFRMSLTFLFPTQ